MAMAGKFIMHFNEVGDCQPAISGILIDLESCAGRSSGCWSFQGHW